MFKKLLASTALAAGMIFGAGAGAAEAHTLKVFGGFTHPDSIDTEYVTSSSSSTLDASFNLDNGFVVGGAIGVSHGDFDFEAELAYRTAEVESITIPSYSTTLPVPGGVDASVTSLMANAWWNAPIKGPINVYVGGGVGLGRLQLHASGMTGSADSTLAYQLGAGVNMTASSGLTYGIGYRNFNMPDADADGVSFDYKSNDFIFEISKKF